MLLRPQIYGFWNLQVESGHIDRLHHNGRSHHAFHETVSLSNSVEVALNMTNEKDTLIIVTADHSHTMSLSGYQARGTNILGQSSIDFGNVLAANFSNLKFCPHSLM